MSIFRFKKFAVDQAESTMKINTDGVLLGGIASVTDPQRILDIGTGTGVIALMLAQRFPEAVVEAIEVDVRAANVAGKNFAESVFAQQLSVHAVALADFQPADTFDLIVSNPPFFLHALKNQDPRKRMSRHAEESFYTDLLDRAVRWLSEQGSLQLILPVPLAVWVNQRAVDTYGLVIQGQQDIRSFASDSPIRRIVALGKGPSAAFMPEEDVVIYADKGVYSTAYRRLLKDFFLAF